MKLDESLNLLGPICVVKVESNKTQNTINETEFTTYMAYVHRCLQLSTSLQLANALIRKGTSNLSKKLDGGS